LRAQILTESDDDCRQRQNSVWWKKAIEIAERYGGSVAISSARPFVDKLYAEWRDSGSSQQELAAWLNSKLQHAFASVTVPPKWVESEPLWAFHEGRPMVFITQADISSQLVGGGEPLSPGEYVYLFGLRVSSENGLTVVFKTLSQFSQLGSSG
jgi:hypothetical protein